MKLKHKTIITFAGLLKDKGDVGLETVDSLANRHDLAVNTFRSLHNVKFSSSTSQLVFNTTIILITSLQYEEQIISQNQNIGQIGLPKLDGD